MIVEKLEKKEKRSQYQREMSSLVVSKIKASRIKSLDFAYSGFILEPRMVIFYHTNIVTFKLIIRELMQLLFLFRKAMNNL